MSHNDFFVIQRLYVYDFDRLMKMLNEWTQKTSTYNVFEGVGGEDPKQRTVVLLYIRL